MLDVKSSYRGSLQHTIEVHILPHVYISYRMYMSLFSGDWRPAPYQSTTRLPSHHPLPLCLLILCASRVVWCQVDVSPEVLALQAHVCGLPLEDREKDAAIATGQVRHIVYIYIYINLYDR